MLMKWQRCEQAKLTQRARSGGDELSPLGSCERRIGALFAYPSQSVGHHRKLSVTWGVIEGSTLDKLGIVLEVHLASLHFSFTDHCCFPILLLRLSLSREDYATATRKACRPRRPPASCELFRCWFSSSGRRERAGGFFV